MITDEQLKELQRLRDAADMDRWKHWRKYCADHGDSDAVSGYAKATGRYERINALIEVGIGYTMENLISSVEES